MNSALHYTLNTSLLCAYGSQGIDKCFSFGDNKSMSPNPWSCNLIVGLAALSFSGMFKAIIWWLQRLSNKTYLILTLREIFSWCTWM